MVKHLPCDISGRVSTLKSSECIGKHWVAGIERPRTKITAALNIDTIETLLARWISLEMWCHITPSRKVKTSILRLKAFELKSNWSHEIRLCGKRVLKHNAYCSNIERCWAAPQILWLQWPMCLAKVNAEQCQPCMSSTNLLDIVGGHMLAEIFVLHVIMSS